MSNAQTVNGTPIGEIDVEYVMKHFLIKLTRVATGKI